MNEQVLVFDEVFLQGFDKIPGFSVEQTDLNRFEEVCLRLSYFADRTKAENDPTKKQVIPYVIVRKDDKILAYKRTKFSTEGRLHDKWSIGVGGHINPPDFVPSSGNKRTIQQTVKRELIEEISFYQNGAAKNIGLVYDASNSVGQVHFGLVMEVYTFRDDLGSNEDAINSDVRWVTLSNARELPNLENWSKMILQGLLNEEQSDS